MVDRHHPGQVAIRIDDTRLMLPNVCTAVARGPRSGRAPDLPIAGICRLPRDPPRGPCRSGPCPAPWGCFHPRGGYRGGRDTHGVEGGGSRVEGGWDRHLFAPLTRRERTLSLQAVAALAADPQPSGQASNTRKPARGKCTTTSPARGSWRRIAMCWADRATISPATRTLP